MFIDFKTFESLIPRFKLINGVEIIRTFKENSTYIYATNNKFYELAWFKNCFLYKNTLIWRPFWNENDIRIITLD